MREDDGGAVVAVVVVEGKAMDDAVEGGHDLGAGGAPDVDAEVEAAGFGFGGGTCGAVRETSLPVGNCVSLRSAAGRNVCCGA